ncbi:hypothetical protein CSUB01_09781 [Colletotrichum sublineola]|uniref:Uncharacterized protein n=1 Tax=Colletotrichum sublineola TaxID=1173701 RepID=A0A066X5S0_COLSU|nr:hypothetical protein CSUB01_09781 [Colletotrichum sublineola]
MRLSHSRPAKPQPDVHRDARLHITQSLVPFAGRNSTQLSHSTARRARSRRDTAAPNEDDNGVIVLHLHRSILPHTLNLFIAAAAAAAATCLPTVPSPCYPGPIPHIASRMR